MNATAARIRAHPKRDRLGSIEAMSARDLAELIERVEVYACEEMMRTVPADAVERYGVRTDRIGAALAHAATRLDVPFFNRVVGLGLGAPITDETLDTVDAIYRGNGIRYMLPISPAVLSDDLHARLDARGFTRMDNWSQLIREADPPTEIPTDLRIEPAGPEHAQVIGEIVASCFGLPTAYAPFFSGPVGRPLWRHYLAFDGPTPVAAGALFVRGMVGYLTFGATLESHRRRGAQGALMTRRIADGAALGCRWLVTEAVEDTSEQPNPSYRNMLRTGFRLAYHRPNYVYFPDGAAPN